MKTKKYLLIILLIIPLISAAQANFGILLGIGRSNIDNYRLYFTRNTSDEPHDVVGYPFESYYAWKAGFYYTIPINKKGLSAGCEFNLSGLGAFIPGGSIEINPGDYSYQPEYAERLIYISIPMYIQYNFGSCWYISTGVTTGLLISKPEINYSNPHQFDFGGNIAFGVTLFPKFIMEINGYHSLTRINEVQDFEDDGDYDNRLFNRSVTVSLKYELSKRK